MKNNRRIYRGFGHSYLVHVLVWLVAVAATVVLFQHRGQRFEVVGIVQGNVSNVSATSTGRIKSISVGLFDKVAKGDSIAIVDLVLDHENLQAERKVVSAEIQQLTAELAATRERLEAEADERQFDEFQTSRRFVMDVETAALEILKIKVQLQTDQILLEDLEMEVGITRQLLEEKAVSAYQLQKAETMYSALAKKIEENEHLLTQAELNIAQARQRRTEYTQRKPLPVSIKSELEVVQKAIALQRERIAQITARHKPLILSAPIGGVVRILHKGAGEVVLAGEPIIAITEQQPTDIIVYVDERYIGPASERTEVQLITNSTLPQTASSQIISLGSSIELMPERLWKRPDIAQWGRPILIKIPPELNLLPGQIVAVDGI